MIYSMTAFASVGHEFEFGRLTSEIRSVNHRYLEISIHCTDILRPLEMLMREKIKQKIKRGKIECALRYIHHSSHKQNVLNLDLAQNLCRASEKITGLLKNPAPINAVEIMRFPGILEAPEADMKSLETYVLKGLDEAVLQLMSAREREGKEIGAYCLQKLNVIEKLLHEVNNSIKEIVEEQRIRLQQRFQDAKLELDPLRLEQEMLFFAQKIDVTEECERLQTHIHEMRRILNDGGVVGRRLDFLLQELNREANTMGGKASNANLIHISVEMKVLIEQMREQVQNIE